MKVFVFMYIIDGAADAKENQSDQDDCSSGDTEKKEEDGYDDGNENINLTVNNRSDGTPSTSLSVRTSATSCIYRGTSTPTRQRKRHRLLPIRR